MASYAVSLLIAKKMHPFTDADFVKDCILAAVDIICPEHHNTLSWQSRCLPALQLDMWRTWPLMSGL